MKVAGFEAAGVAAGLKYSGRLDLGLIAARQPVVAAGVFTRSLVKAAPVLWSREQLEGGCAVAILVNSGQANACTGEAGLAACRASARSVATTLGCPEHAVLLASTGVIGAQLNVAAIQAAMPELVRNLAPENLNQVARAMMTTDTKPKMAEAAGSIGDRTFRVVGLAKGAGMIAPNMATMLSFILTDAAVEAGYLHQVLGRAADLTFNRVTVDGDTSTNDTVLALASGLAGNRPLDSETAPGAEEFARAVTKVMADLARMLAEDGEGATKLVKVVVSGAIDQAQARDAAMTVANSPLVKTAWFGQDANWGRIMGALGRSGAQFDPGRVDVSLDGVPLVRGGLGAGDEAAAAEVLQRREFAVEIDLKAGSAEFEVLTCDFSLDYVKINADYRS